MFLMCEYWNLPYYAFSWKFPFYAFPPIGNESFFSLPIDKYILFIQLWI